MNSHGVLLNGYNSISFTTMSQIKWHAQLVPLRNPYSLFFFMLFHISCTWNTFSVFFSKFLPKISDLFYSSEGFSFSYQIASSVPGFVALLPTENSGSFRFLHNILHIYRKILKHFLCYRESCIKYNVDKESAIRGMTFGHNSDDICSVVFWNFLS